MSHPLTALLILTPAVLMAQEAALVPAQREKLPAISLLPDGSQLKGVMLPRYDSDRKLVGVLKAAMMTLVNDEQIDGEKVSIEFFNPDQSQRGRVDMETAMFFQKRGLLEAGNPVAIRSERLTAHGSGLVYSFTDGRGYLLGPASTTIQSLPETTMHTPSSPLRATAMIGMALLTQSLTAAPPQAMTEDEIATLQKDAASKAPDADAANAETRDTLSTQMEQADAASSAARTFLVQASLPVPAADPPAEPKPLDVKPGPEDTLIQCEGGMYFDADKGELVYLKAVKVTDPRFDLSGANELKVLFSQKEEAAKPAEEKDESQGIFGNVGAGFGDVERIIATGAVLIKQKGTGGDKPPVEASGAIFTYNVKTGEIILSGGYPWVKQGTTYLRATEPNLNLRIQKNGSFATEGDWDMGGKLNQEN